MNEYQLQVFLQNKILGEDYVFGQPIFLVPIQPNIQHEQPQNQLQQPQEPAQQNQQNPEDSFKQKEIPFVLHKVNPNRDTLMGLSIQYKISAQKIRRFNEMDNDEIYYMTTIKIPYLTEEDLENMEDLNVVEKSDEYKEQLQKIEKKQKLTYLKDYIIEKEDQCDEIANYYLQEADWDEKKAKELYQEDLKWEKENSYRQHQNQWIKI